MPANMRTVFKTVPEILPFLHRQTLIHKRLGAENTEVVVKLPAYAMLGDLISWAESVGIVFKRAAGDTARGRVKSGIEDAS